jgi:hypothetical protein
MKKLLLGLLTVTLLAGLVFANPVPGPYTWEFDSLIVNGRAIATNYGDAAVNVPGFRNAYSVTLDPDGKIWCGSYYERLTPEGELPDHIQIINGTDTTEYTVRPIFILDPATGVVDTLAFLNMPDGSIDTLVAGHRGMGTDPQGNIIASFADGSVYKINYQTHDVIRKYNTGGSNGRPGVDADGYVYQMDGVFATKVDILDPDDWSSPFNTITGISAGVTRCMEVSPDGQNVYICSQSGGLHHYYSADGVFGTYTLVDTILATVTVDTTEYVFVTNLAQWNPDGLLWVASQQDAAYRQIFALDPDQDYMVVDSLNSFVFWTNTDQSDTTSGGYAKPQYLRCVRDAYFNAGGNEFYVAEFYGYGIKHYSGVPFGIQPGQGNKEVPGLFTLYHNYPNPFNPTTTISFDLHKSAHVVLRIYDTRGALVGKVIDDNMTSGPHKYQFDARGLASGYYYYKLTVDKSVATGKMLLVR